MARVIESSNEGRRIIKLSAYDVISIVREYQTIIQKGTNYNDLVNILQNRVFFVPEDC